MESKKTQKILDALFTALIDNKVPPRQLTKDEMTTSWEEASVDMKEACAQTLLHRASTVNSFEQAAFDQGLDALHKEFYKYRKVLLGAAVLLGWDPNKQRVHAIPTEDKEEEQ